MAYKLYHEKQEAALCGVHCLNTLLQGQYISEWDLSKIAHEFDAMEATLMGQQGLDTPDYLKFAAEGSGNVARDGMFSIQVLQKALSNWDLTTTPITHPSMQVFSMDPTKAAGENWTIYVVQGTVPIQADLSATYSNGSRLWTPEEAKLAHESSTSAKKRAKGMGIMEDLLKSAKAAGGALILGGGRSTNNSAGSRMVSSTVSPSGVHDLTEDEQLAIAMRESMAGRAGPSGAVPSQQGLASTQNASMGSLGGEEDPDLAHAIAASLAAFQGGSNTGPSAPVGTYGASQGPSSSAIPCGTTGTQSKLGLLSHPVDYSNSGEKAAMEGQAGIAAAPDDEAMVDLVVKLPDNKRVKCSFRRSDRVGYVISWLHGQGCDMKKNRLCRAYPKVPLEDSLRLQDVGIESREMLIVERAP